MMYDFFQIFKRVILEIQGLNVMILNGLFIMDILVRHFKQSFVRILLLLRDFLVLYDRNTIRIRAISAKGFKLDGSCLINTT